MTTRTPWTAGENLALVRLYFEMNDAATTGRPYQKAAMIRHASRDNGPGDTGPLANRSRGSIEAKLMNATACHRDLCPDAETMDGHGYRALSNYQAALKDAMRAELQRRAGAALLPESHPAAKGAA